MDELADFMRYGFLGVTLLDQHDSARVVFLPEAVGFQGKSEGINGAKKSRQP
jgi:hypothetical protein